MKVNSLILINFFLALFIVLSSCKKDDNETILKSGYEKKLTGGDNSIAYPNPTCDGSMNFTNGSGGNKFTDGSKSKGPGFTKGGGGKSFAGGGNAPGGAGGGNFEDCLIGKWIEPPDMPGNCPDYPFHLMFSFMKGGQGVATHMDEYFCEPDIVRPFTWKLDGSKLTIKYTGSGDISVSQFNCDSEELCVHWFMYGIDNTKCLSWFD